MKYKWTQEMDSFIKESTYSSRKELLEALNKKFKTDFTLHSLSTHICEHDIHLGFRSWKGGRTPLPLFSERIKKGYVQIKVAQPDVWKQKQVYIYERAHNVVCDRHKHVVIFLDGNNRNFETDNLYLLDRKYLLCLNNLRCQGDSREATLKKIELVKVRNKMLDVAEKVNLASIYSKKGASFRRLKSYCASYQAEWKKAHPEQEKAIRKRYYEKKKAEMEALKLSDRKEWECIQAKRREKQRAWYLKNKKIL